MRIAFYAPLKPPDHPVPSGDRAVAALLMAALRKAGHEVDIACRLRSRDSDGDGARQRRLRDLGAALARRLVRRYEGTGRKGRPALWFTYHLYDKAPDWVGPGVSRALGIPYVVAEASLAPSRARGPWAEGHRAVEDALDLAAAVVSLNPADRECLPPRLRHVDLAPFLDAGPYRQARSRRAGHRRRIARLHGLDAEVPWLLAVAMMRSGDKARSYQVLARALGRLVGLPWQLLIVGEGPARPGVEAAFRALGPHRVRFAGAVPPDALPAYYAAADLLTWPAINEAYGMALLEAQAAGLPVVAGRVGGVPAVVADGESGLLAPIGDDERFARCVAALLADPGRRRAMADAASAKVMRGHTLDGAARTLDRLVRDVAGTGNLS
jgi:glycosyltransferase involved in cell wall biosynthesis